MFQMSNGKPTLFKNLEPLQIFGFQSTEGSLLKVFLHATEETANKAANQLSDVVVECVDGEKSKQLVDLGIGSYVKLYNIKVILAIDSTHQPKYILTENSGIRSMQRAEEPDHGVEATDGIEAADQKQLRPPPQRWTCLTCNCLNYASKTVCFSCDLPKREGPSGPLWLFKGLFGPPYSYDTWECDSCFARKNSHFKNDCWKCDQPRKNKKQKK